MKPKTLIIEDDMFLGPQLEDYLNNHGFVAYWLADERKWQKVLAEGHFAAVVLDLILPHESGESILKNIKETYPELPVLVLTAKHGLTSKKECFEAGADDYLVKPFEILELELRLRALLRRYEAKESYEPISLGDLKVYPDKGIILKNGEEIFLSKRRWDLLLFLLKNRGRLVTKEEILANVWQDANVNDDTLRSYIKDLRKLLPKNTLVTVHSRGYRLNI
ncbi:response regulator transcription factor [Thermodesulfatator atlanticus]|uniref:response regulator transcription factor n=1 Tax=Thermodesulfatator atlanticus TaxID=501497 RepID=UPI0003B743A4|nr:response regulator transcription factor [Thermodesulfatator atlanticus]